MQKTTAKLGSVCSVTWKFLCVADEIKDEHSLKKNVQAPAKMDSINIIAIVFKAEQLYRLKLSVKPVTKVTKNASNGEKKG